MVGGSRLVKQRVLLKGTELSLQPVPPPCPCTTSEALRILVGCGNKALPCLKFSICREEWSFLLLPYLHAGCHNSWANKPWEGSTAGQREGICLSHGLGSVFPLITHWVWGSKAVQWYFIDHAHVVGGYKNKSGMILLSASPRSTCLF